MRKGNLIIISTCAIALLAEWSAPGRLTFGFPFLTSPARDFQTVPAAWRESRDTIAAKVEGAAPAPQETATCTASPSFDRVQLAAFESAFLSGQITNLQQAETYLGKSCNGEFTGINGDRLTFTESETGFTYDYYPPAPRT